MLHADAGSSAGHDFAVRRSKALEHLPLLKVNLFLAVNAKMAVAFFGKDVFRFIDHKFNFELLSVISTGVNERKRVNGAEKSLYNVKGFLDFIPPAAGLRSK